ncbi:alpha/beta fold hydrolase [Pseudomonas sp. RIT-PI-AD]|uniref:alpha/beta fold hydrolase n=1 Tax=Pseudomonas sp. RIT-PI-AD TaxID=3035294 RepID=UPI0021DA3ED4|nr:alpha/beta fold hydrolase [Pseudomonas sp. RIT-PI-AD]
MRDRLVLLPGWSFGAAALQPLQEALLSRARHLRVDLAELPQRSDADAWLDELDARLPTGAWLAGWSLGGMLATQLAARRGDACPGLITFASNACFARRADWPTAMPAPVFETFCEAFALDAEQTLKRFSLLASRGAFDPRTLARQLQVTQPRIAVDALAAGLRLLADLDGRLALRGYAGPQLHLFGRQDALVPAAAAEALLAWLPDLEVETFDASHGLPLEYPDRVAEALLRFIDGGEHD